MALVTTSVTPSVRVTPFTGISEVQREKSGIARSEVVHSAYGIWPATGAGDNRGLIFSWTLNPDYGYVLMDCNCGFISSTELIEMDASAFLQIETDTGPGATQVERQYYGLHAYPSRQDNSGNTAIGSISAHHYNTQIPAGTDTGAMIFNMPVKPTALLYPFPGIDSIDCAVVFGEQALQEPSLGYRFYCRFLEYDIVQGYNYVVNSPIMTR